MPARVLVACLLILTGSGLLAWVLLPGDVPTPKVPPPPTGDAAFVEIGAWAGVDRPIRYGDADKRTILDVNGPGVALLDYDGDGWLDIYVPTGGALDVEHLEVLEVKPDEHGDMVPTRVVQPRITGLHGEPNRLYRSLGNGRFEEVAAQAGVAGDPWGQGVAVGDYDGDGRPDLYVTNLGPNRMYRNLGQGRFEDVGEALGVADPRWGASACFADLEPDGDLDLVVANYLYFSMAELEEHYLHLCPWKGMEVSCGPAEFHTEPLAVYVQDQGKFEDRGPAMGTKAESEAWDTYPLGVVCHDFDGDGDQDIYVACDTGPNFLYLFQRDRLQQVADSWGLAVGQDGKNRASMGVDLGDVDGDGSPEIYVSNFSDEFPSFYRGPNRPFQDQVRESGLGTDEAWWGMGWGCKFLDYDHDGNLDLLVMQGHLYPQVEQLDDPRQTFAQHDLLFRGHGDGTFEEVGGQMGLRAQTPLSLRGLAVGDLDNDGDLDWLETALDAPPRVWINHLGNQRPWITVSLQGVGGNTEGIGAHLTVTTAGHVQHRWVSRAGSFQSSSDVRAHFGLGASESVDSLEVRWPAGGTMRFRNLAARKHYVVSERDGLVETREPAPGW